MHYVAPDTVEDAVRALSTSSGTAHVLAGGTDLVVQMTGGMRSPDLMVNIKNIHALSMITEDSAGFHIGAAVSAAALCEHAGLVAAWPGLIDGIKLIGSMQVQSRATPAGNLCNASPGADSVPPMIAAGATVTIIGAAGKRTVPVEEIPVSPGRTILGKDEMVVTINLPPKPRRSGDAYLRFTPRSEMDIAVVGAAVNLTLDDAGKCIAARVALGAVAPTAILVKEAGAALIGTQIDADAIENAALAVRRACKPIDDKRGTAEFRVKVAGVIFKRAVAVAVQRATRRERA